jgi:hypothetical protein
MALLADAIRASDTQTAIYRAPQGYAVVVQRVTGREEPDSEEEYDVFVDRGDQRGPWRIAALDLIEALDRMGSLGLPGFDPASDQWQPTTLPEPAISPQDREDYLRDSRHL